MDDAKLSKIQTLKYIVFSRWFLHLGILLLGLIQKIIDVAQFDPKIFILLGVSYSYNLAYYLYLRRSPGKISKRGLYIISLLQVIVDQLLFSIIIYATGGIESLSFLFYFLTIFMAILLFNELEIITLTFLSGFFYLSIIILEYIEIIPHQWRYDSDPGFFQNTAVTVHNSATVVLIIIFTAFFAAFIGRIIRSREDALKAETEKVNVTINNLIDGVMVLDHRGRIVLINPTASDMLKKEKVSVLNKKMTVELFANNLKPLTQCIYNNVKEKRNRSREICIDERGMHLTLKVNCLILFDRYSEIKGYLTIIRNITREKELDSLKSDFISIAAHQLRTPLATIKWLFKMLLEGDAGKLNSRQNDLLVKGFKRNNEVIEIVNNLLDVSEIEEGKTTLRTTYFSLDKVLEQISNNSKDNATHANLKFTYIKPKKVIPPINADLQKIRMSIQNLVDNAIKYTLDKGSITLSVDIVKSDVIIKIADTGIGIAEGEKDKIFSKFFRSKKAISEEPTGSGLGLYIVKNIIEKHKGKIWFDSQENQGTTFYIKLPIIKNK